MTEARINKGWREGLEEWCGIMPELELDPKKTSLLVIDMQLCFAHRDYSLGKMAAARPALADYYFTRVENIVVPNHVKLLEFFRNHGLRVIFVCAGSEVPDLSDLSPSLRLREEKRREQFGTGAFPYRGDPEYSLLPELKRREEEPIINKVSLGVFNSTGIDFTLRNIGIDGLVITGVATHSCVEVSARDAADRGYKCILVEDACAGFSEEAQNATLRAFARICGNVKTTEEVLRLLS